MQRSTDSLSKENEHLSKIISELKEERDRFRQQAGKTRQELSELLGEKERIDCENADLKRTVLGLEERLKDAIVAQSEVTKASSAAETQAQTEAQAQNQPSAQQHLSTNVIPSKQEEPLPQVPASNSQAQSAIDEAAALPISAPTDTSTANITIQSTVSDIAAVGSRP
ncbi:uncharacterized protein EV420DRAFT_498534 [Desarmillaria tabescens]|uniref:Uncharacterized protein n=1 Tax=Armillaria tabescens TaxID=1929756 RepID=A0AA39KCL8_ARMTA|nr:uncharacterized protein EV420DRAFT_498534 [Desarmillaria tabescens]KAK0457500.1 hypothetical protein EV420DRAFT_498534 [Desarmillaria tabescens]